MQTILIANPKGGSGKSTLATNLAGYFAWEGEQVMLGDIDRQQTSRHWLQLRPENYPRICSWDLKDREPARPPKGTTVAVLDSPAGLHGKKFEAALKVMKRVLVPVRAGFFDMWASEDFFRQLAEEKAVRKGEIKVGLVGMGINPRTRSAQELEAFFARFDLPVLTHLRETQLYVQLQPKGLTLFDLPRPRFERDYTEWQPIQ
jgi:chromosome partitioning protein